MPILIKAVQEHMAFYLNLILWCSIFWVMSMSFAVRPLGCEENANNAGMQTRDAGYFAVKGPCGLNFPGDHGPHPGYRIEWWYYTGNLKGAAGERFGFQLTFFRTQISPCEAKKTWPEKPSAWRTQQVFLAHAAISDLDREDFFYDEKMARGAVGLAGVMQESSDFRIFLGNWSACLGSLSHRLRAESDDFDMELICRPLKPPVLHGVDGYSKKGTDLEDASCYYSFTRLLTSGTLTIRGTPVTVNGTAWMDHEFSTAPLQKEVVGWDWFSIQLENNSELMIYLLRHRNGGYSVASSGTFVPVSGEPLHLTTADFQLRILDNWKSQKSGAQYPSRWHLQVYPVSLDLMVTSNLADQELRTQKTTQVIYWEGSVSVSGKMGDQAALGVGYVEMTGYARPFNLLHEP